MQKITGHFEDLPMKVKWLTFYVSGRTIAHEEDQGIGSYEFWGGHYNDTQIVMVSDTFDPDFIIDSNDNEYEPDEFKVKYPNIYAELEYLFFDTDLEGYVDWEDE